jgi:transcriptional regulator with XRE-family HTH domain
MTGPPPAHRMILGAALREYRASAGLTLTDAARLLGCDVSKISRIESGQRGIRPGELQELLAEYGADESSREILAALARAARERSRLRHLAAGLPGSHLDHLVLERAAARIQAYDVLRVPDLLQTTEYARALACSNPGLPADSQDTRVRVLLDRQHAVLRNRKPEIAMIIGEGALRQRVGGADVMRVQRARLAEAATSRDRVTIQVLPFADRAHLAIGAGSLALLWFGAEPGSPGVVQLAGPADACLTDQAEVRAYADAFTRLTRVSLSPGESARLLQRMARRGSS